MWQPFFALLETDLPPVLKSDTKQGQIVSGKCKNTKNC